MSSIRYDGQNFRCEDDESVLECLVRNNVSIQSSCRSGVCQTCRMRVVEGDVPAASQIGLRDTQIAQGLFLCCVCRPKTDLEVAPDESAGARVTGRVTSVEPLNGTVLRLRIAVEDPFDYVAGQFVNFVRSEDLVRSYSIASVQGVDAELEFHIGIVPGGRMSGWIHHEAQPGDALEIMGPLGGCFYTQGRPEQPLILFGTGTGLAPLYGILRDALSKDHSGEIHLFHGSLSEAGLYLVGELRRLSAAHENFRYYPCILDGEAQGLLTGSVDKIALETLPNLKGWRVYLCGDPAMVNAMQRKTFLAGAGLKDIYADAFIPAATAKA